MTHFFLGDPPGSGIVLHDPYDTAKDIIIFLSYMDQIALFTRLSFLEIGLISPKGGPID